MRNKILLCLFLPCTALAAPICKTVDVKIPLFDAPAATEKKELCEHGKEQWSSPLCANNPANCKSEWKKFITTKKIDIKYNGFGSPGFELCSRLGGTPIMAKIIWNAKEQSTDFCAFEKEGYVDLELVQASYREASQEAAKVMPKGRRR
jgi:hypothetical protein